jgi:mannose-6-phosphate isomerase-like protein (cupin superfamily)
MNRRSFLKLSLAATPLALTAHAAELATAPEERADRGFRVGANTDRHGEELQLMGGRFDLKVSAKDTGGGFCLYDTTRQSKGGPALHLHYAQDEWFYVIRGEFVVQVGEDTVRLRPGDSALAPRKIPHAFAKVSEDEGQMLVMFQPAGRMEDFFREMAKLGPGIPRNQERDLKELWARYGMELVGPPLKF